MRAQTAATPSVFRTILTLTLILTLAVPAEVFAQAVKPQETFDYAKVFAGDPMWDDFVQAPWVQPKYGPFDKGDTLLDQDPYFLRSQAWVKSGAISGDSVAFVEGTRALSLQIPSSEFRLVLNGNFRAVFETEAFIFLQNTNPQLFTKKSDSDESPAEGLFYIPKDYMLSESQGAKRPVPVLFLPLHGTGWTQTINAVSFAEGDLLAISNPTGNQETIEFEDVHALTKLYLFNLRLAVIQKLKNNPDLMKTTFAKIQSGSLPPEFPFVLPARGSTAGFGMFYTTLDLDQPDGSIAKIKTQPSYFSNIFLPKAHADDLLSPDFLNRLLIIGGIVSTALVASIVLKYTVLKERMAERRAYVQERKDDLARKTGKEVQHPPQTRLNHVTREAKEIVDVFSHSLATVSGFVTTSTGYLLEYMADKLPGKTGYSPNGYVRRFLEYTFLYSRNQGENIAANWNTFILGVAVLGTIDTAFVALQLLVVSPIFFPWASQAFGNRIEERVTNSFSGGNEDMNNIVTSEIIRNLSAYVASGAYSYSSEVRNTMIEIVGPEITKEMRAKGLDPALKENETEFKKRLEARIDRLLIERGLPSRKEFLFSAPSTVRKIAHFLGYEVGNILPKSEGNTEKDKFILEQSRWGIVGYSLKRALEAAQELSVTSNGPEVNSAIQVLQSLQTRFHVLKRMVTNWRHPWQNLKDAVDVRRALTLLSYDGPIVGNGLRYKDLWKKFNGDQAGAELAGKLFRQSLFGLIQDQPAYLQPSSEDSAKFLLEALKQAQEEAKELTDSNAEYVLLRSFEILKKKILERQAAAAANDWKPAKQGWLERWQRRRAHEAAVKATSSHVPTNTDDLEVLKNASHEAYREEYRKALARQVGLHVLPPEKSALVRMAMKAADSATEDSIKNNQGKAAYIETLHEIEKVQFKSHLYANNFLTAYTELTYNNSTVVPLTSSEQPGRLQWLRQLSFVDSDTFMGRTLTKVLRGAESLVDATAFGPGLEFWARRNFPFAIDAKVIANQKMRGIWTAATVGWAGSYYIWQVKFPWDTYVFFFLTLGFTSMASQWLDRFNMNLGNRPMEGIGSKIKYSVMYSWVTYPTYIPFMFFIDDWKAMTGWVSTKTSELATATGTAVTNTAQECMKLLGLN